MTPIDVARARRETPGANQVLHFNNAGAALMPETVRRTLRDHLDLEAAIGGYEAEDRRAEALAGFYDEAAALINAAPDEIAFVENATRAWDMAFYALPFRAGDRILTAEAEYASNYIAYLQVARRTGAVVEAVPSDEAGQLSLEALAARIDERVKLIAVTHVPTNGGLVNPAAAIGRIARAAGIPFLLDACQSVGQMPIDVAELHCDMLSATGRKYLRGPRGTGFLYVRRALIERLEPVFLDLHAARWVAPDRYEVRKDAKRFENWESHVAGRLGFTAAISYARGWGLAAIRDRVYALAADLRGQLSDIPGVVVRDRGRERCGIVTFTVDGVAAEAVKAALCRQAINVTTSGRESTLLDMSARGLDTLVRASLHYYNDNDEIARFSKAIATLARGGAASLS